MLAVMGWIVLVHIALACTTFAVGILFINYNFSMVPLVLRWLVMAVTVGVWVLVIDVAPFQLTTSNSEMSNALLPS